MQYELRQFKYQVSPLRKDNARRRDIRNKTDAERNNLENTAMKIILKKNRVIIQLTELEFQAFENMFANLNDNHRIMLDGLDWPPGSYFDGKFSQTILPMHLCRTIGEACAVEQAGPLDLLSLYPFWKYGFCFSEESSLKLEFAEIDPHKKANLADEFGMGFTAWAMEELFKCVAWCDTADALTQWEIEKIGSRLPDFVCLFDDGSFGVFEAKGTTTTLGTAKSQTEDGKEQTATIEATGGSIAVRCACGIHLGRTGISTLVLRDPPPGDAAIEVNLTPDAIIRGAEARRYRENLFGDIRTLFVSDAGEFNLVRTPYIEEKRHGWLNIT